MTTSDPVHVSVDGAVMTITLADVERRNVLSPALVTATLDALGRATRDPAIRAVVLTNEGRVFCAGADLSTPALEDSPKAAGVETLFDAMRRSPAPIVGRIAGHAVGGGMGLVASCDITVAVDDALFGFTEVRLGVAPAIISVVCLPRLRRADALETFLRGHRFSAARAVDIGMVNHAVPAEQLDDEVATIVADLLLGGPEALAMAKRLVHDVPLLDPVEAFEWTTRLSVELFGSDEAAEGMAAFREKRRPSWAPES